MQVPRITGDGPLAQRAGHETALDVERRNQDLPYGPAGFDLPPRPFTDQCLAPGGPADPEDRDVETRPEIGDLADPGVRAERGSRRGVIEETRREEPVSGRPERLGDPAVGLATAGRAPESATQRDHGGIDRGRHRLDLVGHRRDRRAIADPHDQSVAHDCRKDLRGQAPHAPTGALGIAADRGGEMGRPQTESSFEVGRNGARALGPVDDPDLDHPLVAGLLEQLRDLWPRHADGVGDRLLGLAQLVVHPTHANQRLEADGARHERDPPRITRVSGTYVPVIRAMQR